MGDEVVLAFFRPDGDHTKTGALVVKRQLFDFKRVHLLPGESRVLTFTLTTEQLALIDVDGNKGLFAGEHEIIFSRGHGKELTQRASVDVSQPVRLHTFRKWWRDEVVA